MSWTNSNRVIPFTSSLEVAEGFKPTSSAVTESPCAPSKSKSTNNNSSQSDSPLCQYGMMLRPSAPTTASALKCSDNSALWLTNSQYAADFRVRTCQVRERCRALMAQEAACGASTLESFARYDPASCSWKTLQTLFDWDLDECSRDWPERGMLARGIVWKRRTSARDIIATVFGERLSARTCSTDGGGAIPTANICGLYNRKGASANSGDGLDTWVRRQERGGHDADTKREGLQGHGCQTARTRTNEHSASRPMYGTITKSNTARSARFRNGVLNPAEVAKIESARNDN